MSPVQIEENYVFPKFVKTEEDRNFIAETIADNFIFGVVSKEEMTKLLDAFEEYTASVGTKIITEGDVGDYFYIIMDGKVEFTVNSERVGNAGKGKAFGDLALLYDCPRAATCVAAENCALWRVDKKTFRQILANGRVNGDKVILKVLHKVKLLEGLSDEYLAKIAAATTTKTFVKGDVIIKKGDIGTKFFMLKDGTVTVKDIEAGGDKFADQIYKEGDFFGERALLTEEPRAANIIANEDCTTLILSRENFLNVVGPLETLVKKAQDLQVLQSVPAFATSDLKSTEYEELVTRIVEREFKAGTQLYTEGEDTEPAIWFVRNGKVEVSSLDKTYDKIVSMGGCFGVTGTILHKVPCASVKVVDDCMVGVLSKADLKAVIRTFSRLNKDSKELQEKESIKERASEIPLDPLKNHRILGVGTSGKIPLVSREHERETGLSSKSRKQLLTMAHEYAKRPRLMTSLESGNGDEEMNRIK